HRDGWTIPALQDAIYERARIPAANVSPENRAMFEESGHVPHGGCFTVSPSPQDIHILVAGGPGKHSAWIPSFGGTAVVSVRVKPGE
ncbi:MAG: hypothetical protein J2P47_13995, partial [Acetobacteraceae bacterium]|nr:hypothetical protein [Acetobacteraceae bacterium]